MNRRDVVPGPSSKRSLFSVSLAVVVSATMAAAPPGARPATRPGATGGATAGAATRPAPEPSDPRVKAAVEVLRSNPADAEANAVVGRWLCYDEAQWERGLPMLAKGSDAPLKELAKRDLAGSDVPIVRVVLGHDWWDYAATQQGPARVRCQERAAYWYRLSLPHLEGERKTELQKRIAAADAEAEAAFAKLGVPRPVDPAHALLDREALRAAATTPLEPRVLEQDATFAPAENAKPYRLQGSISVAGDKPLKLVFEPGVEVRGGTVDLVQRGHVVAKGTKDKPVVFRDVTFLQDLGASFTAEHAVFDNCQFHKGGSWFDYHSSKWTFTDCLLFRCAFGRLTGVDYGFQLRRCALVSMDLPEVAHRRGEGFDHMALLRGQWNWIESCDFLDCAVPPTAAWCAQKSNFFGCRFKPGEPFDSAKDAEVSLSVKDTVGDDPQKVWEAGPPKRGKVRLVAAEKPFDTTRFAFPGKPPVPEVAVHDGRARVVVPLPQATAVVAPPRPPVQGRVPRR